LGFIVPHYQDVRYFIIGPVLGSIIKLISLGENQDYIL